MECFLPKILSVLDLYNWGLVQAQVIGPTFLKYSMLCMSGRISNYGQRFSNIIKKDPGSTMNEHF